MNKTFLKGFVGKDPEVKTNQGGDKYARFSLATTEKWKDKQGNQQSKTEWHTIVAFGNVVDVIAKHVRKGSELLVEGKINYQTVEGQDGVKKFFTNIRLINMEFCGKASGSGRPYPENAGPDYGGGSSDDGFDSGPSTPAPAGGFDDDIPFQKV